MKLAIEHNIYDANIYHDNIKIYGSREYCCDF